MFEPKRIAKAELYSENFEHYFTEKLNMLTPEQKAALPIELSNKIFKYGTVASSAMLNLNEKMWILDVVFNLQTVITVLDPENGLNIKDYTDALKAQKGKITNGKLLEGLRIKSVFVLGSRELMASLLYMAHVSNSNIYQLVKKYVANASHDKNSKFILAKDEFNTTLNFIKNYEANRKRITTDYGFTMPDWYALLYFSRGEEFGRHFYKRDFIYAHNSNNRTLHGALQKMFMNGYLNKRSIGKKDKYIISAKGIDVLERIFKNVLLKV